MTAWRYSVPRDGVLCAFYVVLAMGVSWSLGQDMNWDLLNYHLYNPYLLLANRFDRDVHVAGVQTFLNPIFDLPVYFAIRNAPPVVVGLALATFHGIGLWLIHRLTTLLVDPATPRVALTAGFLAAGTAASGAGFRSELGATMGDNTMSVFVLAALVLLLADIGRPPGMRRGCWSGLLIGLAAGAKIIAGIYAIGLATVCLTMPGNRRPRVMRTLSFAVAVGCGLLLTGGYWTYLMFEHYGSPVFPFYNAIFRSSYAPTETNFTDARFLPRSLLQALFYPFFIASTQNLVAEHAFRDARLAAAAVSLALLGALAALRRARTGVAWQRLGDARLARLALFVGVSYLVWLKIFSIYRYAMPLELVSGALVVGTLTYAVRRPKVAVAVALPVCLFLAVWTRPLDWGRVPWSTSYFNVDGAMLQTYDAATVLMWDMPNAYLVPFFPESATFLRLRSNWGLTRDTLMWARLRDRVSRTGPDRLFFLETRTKVDVEEKQRVLRELGFALDMRRCQWIPSAALVHRICAVQRTEDAPG